MALITGSTTIDWSTVALQSSQNFQQQFGDFGNTVTHVFTEVNAGHFTFNGPHSSTFVSLTLTTGDQETVTATGSRFFQVNLDPVIKTFSYDNPVTHETMQFSGTIDFVGNEVVNRLTVGTPGSTATIIGNVILDPQGNIVSGNVTEVRETIGSTEVSVKGSLVLSSTGDLSGTVSQISVLSETLSGTNTIMMSGLSIPFSAIDTVATVNDLFSAVGNLMAGNDTIVYTNNSLGGMTVFGGAGNDIIGINGLNGDTLNGGAGNDILIGGAGDDTLLGGDGDDVFVIGNATDHGSGEVITGGVGNDVIRFASTTSGQTLVLAPGVTEVEGVTISTAAGLTTGTTALDVDASAVTSGLAITGNAGANVLTGTAFNDVLTGNAGNDELEGEDGNDTLIGGLGNDTLVGGVGDDTYVIGQGTDVLTENLNEGTDTVQSSINYTLGANFENLTLTGVGAINGTGNELVNVLTGNSGANILTGGAGNDTLLGNAGNDTLDGGTGDDTMDGSAGNDTYLVDSSNDIVTESIAGAPGGVDLVKSSATFDLGAGSNVENLTLVSGAGPIDATGNELKNVLTGNESNNVLDGGAGADMMAGGMGNDTYVVDVATDVVTEAANAGTDTVRSSINYTLGANVENLTLTGGANLNGTGNTVGNSLTGNSGNNQLDGGLGQDTVDGGAGDDQITMLVTAGNVDTIDAGDGTDTLVLSGVVPGNHEAVVDLSSTTDQVVSIGGTPEVLTQTNFENLNAAGIGSSVRVKGSTGDNVIIGSKGNDRLIGGAGNDTLTGGAGCDAMIGGQGNDTYVIDDLDDRITELFGEGTDTVNINRSVDLNLAPFVQIENVLLTGTAAINATGNGGDNQLGGNSAANILSGGSGNDSLTGYAGNDTLIGGEGNDTLNGGEGNDTYRYGASFFAPEGNDTINDSGGNDRIVMTGSDFTGLSFEQSGNDLNVFSASGDSVLIADQYAGQKVESLQFASATPIPGVVIPGVTGGTSMYGYALGSTPYLLNTATDHNGGLQNDLIVAPNTGGILNGNGGNDLLFGSNSINGDDTLNGGAGNDLLVGGGGSDTLKGGDGNDTIVAGSGTVEGGAGDDRIFMDVTTNIFVAIDAGTGNDTLMLGGIGDVVVDLSKAGDQVLSIGGMNDDPTQDNFENLDASGLINLSPPGFPPVPGLSSSVNVTGSVGNNIITGSQGDDTLNGGAGNDTLAGGLGDDQLDGGEGNDIFRYDTTTTAILNPPFPPTIVGWGKDTISDSGGNDLMIVNGSDLFGETFTQSGNDLVVSNVFNAGFTIHNQYAAGGASKVESLKFDAGASMYGYALASTPYLLNTDPGHNGGLQNDIIAGTSIGETLNGNGGNDLLFGNGGNDTLNGGAGNDLLVGGVVGVPSTGNTTINGGDGNDTILAGSGPVTGGAGDDRIFMDFTNNSVVAIDAGIGNDTLMLGGNGGNVEVHLENGAGDQVTVINGLPDNSLVQNNFENIDASGLDGSLTATGNAGANTIIGSDFADTLNGGAGNDRLDGGAGNDVMDGGAGNDTYVVDSSNDTAAESVTGVAGGVDLVQSSASSYTLGANVENLTLLGTADINGTGNILNNILTGNSGSNSLDGGAGADKMAGGLGNDTYRVDAAGDVVTEALNAGTDNVISSVTYTLGANLENLQLISGANINGTGNTLDNVLTGSNGDNLLSGLGGNDTLWGVHGNDTLNGGAGNDTYLFDLGDGNDVIQDNSGCLDTILFDSGINHQDLVISKQANDLRLAIHGSTDQITVKNWFVGTTNQTEIIQASDGQVLVNTQVQQLIDAMAQFTTNTGVSWDDAVGGAGDQAQFQGILAANWGS